MEATWHYEPTIALGIVMHSEVRRGRAFPLRGHVQVLLTKRPLPDASRLLARGGAGPRADRHACLASRGREAVRLVRRRPPHEGAGAELAADGLFENHWCGADAFRMRYAPAVLLVAVGIWAAFLAFVSSLGEALCESGCAGPTDKPELLFVLAVVSLAAAGLAGRRAWREENRVLDPADRDGVGATVFLTVGLVVIGMLIGAGVILLTAQISSW
jgi:hypothetical protein